MIQPTIDHQIVGSFMEFVTHQILDKGRDFSIVSTGFYDSTGRYNGKYVYSSPFKPFVYDNSISGVSIMSGVSGAGNFYTRSSGIIIDYKNGRILSNSPLSALSGTFTLNNIPVQHTHKNEIEILTSTKYVKQNETYTQTTTGIAESVVTYPIVLVTYTPGTNVPRALGGMDDTQAKISAYCIMDNAWNLDGVLSILRDTNQKVFGLFTGDQLPLNVYGDLKNVSYSYTDTCSGKRWPETVTIEKVRTSKMTPEVNSVVGSDVYCGIVDFDLSYYRFPRV